MVKRSNICKKCNTRPVDGIGGFYCHLCYRSLAFGQLPDEEKKLAILETVPARYINAEIADLSPKIQKTFAAKIENGMLLWGAVGSGKSYAMSVLAKKYITEGYFVTRLHYEMLCLKLRDTFNSKATQTEWQVIEPLLNCDKLFIEDVGASRSLGNQESDHSVRTFTILLDIRLEHFRPTFITSNKSLENISESFDERVGDRLKLFTILNMDGESRRG